MDNSILIITFSDNFDHQDIAYGLHHALQHKNGVQSSVVLINKPKITYVSDPEVHLVNCPRRPGICFNSFNIIELIRISRWINSKHFKIIYFESLHLWNLFLLVIYHNRIKMIQMIHDIIPHQGDNKRLFVYLLSLFTAKLANRVTVCSKQHIATASSMFKIPTNKISFVELSRRFPQYSPPSFTKTFLFFGRINPYKGVNNLITLIRSCPHANFLVVGKVDQQCETQIHQLMKYSNVKVINQYVSSQEMDNYFKISDWVILPYSSATQSGVIVDSYRNGRPCIAFDVGAISEQIIDNITGYLIPDQNINLFIQKINFVLKMSKNNYSSMSLSAYHFGMKHYDALNVVDSFLQILE